MKTEYEIEFYSDEKWFRWTQKGTFKTIADARRVALGRTLYPLRIVKVTREVVK